MGLGPILEKLPHVVGPLNQMQKGSYRWMGLQLLRDQVHKKNHKNTEKARNEINKQRI